MRRAATIASPAMEFDAAPVVSLGLFVVPFVSGDLAEAFVDLCMVLVMSEDLIQCPCLANLLERLFKAPFLDCRIRQTKMPRSDLRRFLVNGCGVQPLNERLAGRRNIPQCFVCDTETQAQPGPPNRIVRQLLGELQSGLKRPQS